MNNNSIVDGEKPMGNKTSMIAEYFSWLLSKYNELNQEANKQESFRLIDLTLKETGEYLLKIQVIGKTIIFESAAKEIVSNDEFIEKFSKKDIRTITYLAMQELQNPKYKIIEQEITEESGDITFKLSQQGNKILVKKTASELSLDKNLINDLNQADAHLVGYAMATEQAAKESKQKEKLRKFR